LGPPAFPANTGPGRTGNGIGLILRGFVTGRVVGSVLGVRLAARPVSYVSSFWIRPPVRVGGSNNCPNGSLL
jgi:hypothetical protein